MARLGGRVFAAALDICHTPETGEKRHRSEQSLPNQLPLSYLFASPIVLYPRIMITGDF